MLTLDDIKLRKNFLLSMGFKTQNGQDSHHLILEVNNYIIKVIYPYMNPTNDTQEHGFINWGNKITVGPKTSSSFANKESLDQLFWVVHLLKCGYSPEDIGVEIKWHTGHKNSGGRMDIILYNKNNDTRQLEPWCILDAKTRGKEFNKYTTLLKNMAHNNQVASYYGYSPRSIKYIGTATTRTNNGIIKPVSFIASTNGWSYSNGQVHISKKSLIPLRNSFEFDISAALYHNRKRKTIDELPKISTQEKSRSILNKFAELIRRNGISDKANAYNKILNLFIAKIYDEYCATHEVKRHQIVLFRDNPNVPDREFMNNLITLYDNGMKNLININSDKNIYMDKLRSAISNLDNVSNTIKNKIINDAEEVRTHSDSTFLFKPVYDNKTYHDNVSVVRGTVDIIENYEFVDPHKQEFLGDFFEGILKNGFQQESGQFFTPIPIGRYIMRSLPLKHILHDTIVQRGNLH